MQHLRLSVLTVTVSFSLGISMFADADDTASTQPNRRLDYLVTAELLSQWAGKPSVCVLDVRRQDAYQLGHIPGAQHVAVSQWETRIAEAGGLTDQAFWAQAVGRLGVDRATRVVVVGDRVPNAARIWWLLKYLGVSDVRMLDGGWRVWVEAGLTVESTIPQVDPVSFQPDFQENRLITLEQLVRLKDNPNVRLLDARGPEEFTGTKTVGSRPGRIPHAIHVDWWELLDEQGRFLPTAQLQQIMVAKNLSPNDDRQIIVYCYSGVRSSVDALVLELLGYAHVKNYNGGWRQWSSHPELPATLGSD